MQDCGFQLEHCRPNCPKAAQNWQSLYEKLTTALAPLNLKAVFGRKFDPLLYHHVPKLCLAGCPNGCSQPRIKDFGMIGYIRPLVTQNACSSCQACVWACLEKAITLNTGPSIDPELCLECGDCIRVCPTGALSRGETGWKLYLGGRVGRHPRFAELANSFATDRQVVTGVMEILRNYELTSLPQERLSHFLERSFKTGSDLKHPEFL